MAQEIERKFLIAGDFRGEASEETQVVQGYLSSAAEHTVRVRISGRRGYITVKGASDPAGIERFEWEKEIPVTEARDLLKLCYPGIIEKTRYKIKCGSHFFEVDEFHGENEGLIIAEVELSSPDEFFERPSWLGKEVTGDQRYYNSYLSRNPYSGWRC
ncbi:MAG: CYTH domain-containing protein [Bacteroidales bacterium]